MKIEPRKGMIIEDTNDNLHELECGCTCGCGNPFLVFADYCFKNDRLFETNVVLQKLWKYDHDRNRGVSYDKH